MESKHEKLAKVGLFILLSIYGASSWIVIYGVFVEIPIFVQVLPEGWDIPSYLAIIVQVANIAPISYIVVKKWKPKWVKDWIASFAINILGIVSAFVLTFTWDKTSYVGGELHSTSLFVLTFFLSLVDCTTTVIYLPYMAGFISPTFLTAMYVGQGLSGLVPAVIGFIQGSGEELDEKNHNLTMNDTTLGNMTVSKASNLLVIRFSVGVYMVIMTILLITSLVSFAILHFHPVFDIFKFNKNGVKKETKVEDEIENHQVRESTETFETNINTEIGDGDWETDIEISKSKAISVSIEENVRQKDSCLENEETQGNENTINSIDNQSSNNPESVANTPSKDKSSKNVLPYIALYSTIIWISALCFGLIPAILSYTCLPYGYLAYDLTNKLSVLINPMACFITLFYRVKNIFIIILIGVIGTLLTGYTVALAFLSPDPILKGETIGVVLVVLINVVIMALFSYQRVCIDTIFYENGNGNDNLLLYSGLLTQFGAFFGALVGFLLVSVFKVFKSD